MISVAGSVCVFSFSLDSRGLDDFASGSQLSDTHVPFDFVRSSLFLASWEREVFCGLGQPT